MGLIEIIFQINYKGAMSLNKLLLLLLL